MAIINDQKNKTDIYLKEIGYNIFDECRQAIEIAEINRQFPVLDIATGSGRMAGALSDAGCFVYTGDIDCASFLKIKDRLGDLSARNITFIPFDAGNIPFPDNSINTIICANALHEMDEPISVLLEMIRICSNCGKIVIVDFNEFGLDIMTMIHQKINYKDHNRGYIKASEITDILKMYFSDVKNNSIKLDDLWVASGKKSRINHKDIHADCFACGKNNNCGLKLEFVNIDDNTVIACCKLGDEYQGYTGTLQGGIISSILDSAMLNCLFSNRIIAKTIHLNVRFSKPVFTNKYITVSARLIKQNGRLFNLEASIMQSNKKKASAEALFMKADVI